MARTKKSPIPKKPEFSIHTVSLTPDVVKALQHLSRDASDFLGRTISSSAIVRALVRQTIRQGPPASDALFFEVERELKEGIMWGS